MSRWSICGHEADPIALRRKAPVDVVTPLAELLRALSVEALSVGLVSGVVVIVLLSVLAPLLAAKLADEVLCAEPLVTESPFCEAVIAAIELV